jgi:cyclase
MNHDGTRDGFACNAIASLSESLSIPVIASGGAGSMEHFAEVFTKGRADAGLAASIFHFREITVPQLKEYLDNQQIPVRIISQKK